MPLVGGGFCCFLASEEVNDTGSEESEECEGANYAAGDCAGRDVVRGAGFGSDGGEGGTGICVRGGRCIVLVSCDQWWGTIY